MKWQGEGHTGGKQESPNGRKKLLKRRKADRQTRRKQRGKK
jgi:hypothetical protein